MSGGDSEQWPAVRPPLARKLSEVGRAALSRGADSARATMEALRSHLPSSPPLDKDPQVIGRRRSRANSNSSGDPWGGARPKSSPGLSSVAGVAVGGDGGNGVPRIRKGYLLMMRGGTEGAAGEWLERFFYLSGHFLRYKKQSLNLTSVNLKHTDHVEFNLQSAEALAVDNRNGDPSFVFQ
ncbi:unnamed protein product, partial [Discosporangium mesarthrocarpum]